MPIIFQTRRHKNSLKQTFSFKGDLGSRFLHRQHLLFSGRKTREKPRLG